MDDLTILIPTRNRPYFLNRLLKYFEETKLPCLIMIADSSNVEAAAENRARVDQSSLHIQYLHFPPETHFFRKLADSLERSDAEFINLCADDDFLSPSGLALCLAYFKSHPSCGTVRGRTVSVAVHNGHATLQAYPQRSILSRDPLRRLAAHLDNYTTTFYSMHRRTALIKAYRAAQEWKQSRFDELLTSSLDVIEGRVKTIDCLHTVRQTAGKRKTTSATVSGWAEEIVKPEFPELRKAYIEKLAAVLPKHPPHAARTIDDALSGFLAKAAAPRSTRKGRVALPDRCFASFLQRPSRMSAKRLICSLRYLPSKKALRDARVEYERMSALMVRYPGDHSEPSEGVFSRKLSVIVIREVIMIGSCVEYIAIHFPVAD